MENQGREHNRLISCSLHPLMSLLQPKDFASPKSRMEHETALRDALSEDGDLELRCHDGSSIPVHSLKLKLASSVLKDVIASVLDDQIASATAKRRKIAEGNSASTGRQGMPTLQVCRMHGLLQQAFHCLHRNGTGTVYFIPYSIPTVSRDPVYHVPVPLSGRLTNILDLLWYPHDVWIHCRTCRHRPWVHTLIP